MVPITRMSCLQMINIKIDLFLLNKANPVALHLKLCTNAINSDSNNCDFGLSLCAFLYHFV